MTMFQIGSHYLAYGATDQQTLRDLQDAYTGVLVPGTIAAWQRNGTGGFVLTLSATTEAPPYAIDPRFPLFQQALPEPKASHRALAEIFEDSELVADTLPSATDFSDERVQALAKAWVKFNTSYLGSSANDFGKYARRLGRPVEVSDAKAPERVLAPYFMATDPSDPWWLVSQSLFESTNSAANGQLPVTRVVAAVDAGALRRLLPTISDPECAVWVSDLNEYTSSVLKLSTYRSAIEEAHNAGTDVFALYGGPFSVLLNSVGLLGAAHGVGFGENRAWAELPRSGAAPPRYYLPSIHRYVSLDLAQQLWQRDPTLTDCGCDDCGPSGPAALDYHALMRHSVRCRHNEIQAWRGISAEDAAAQLVDSFDTYEERVKAAGLPLPIERRALEYASHLNRWSVAILP